MTKDEIQALAKDKPQAAPAHSMDNLTEKQIVEKQEIWVAELKAREEQEVKARHAAGRYTLDEAAKLIGANAPISANFILEEMMKSAGTGELKVYKPGRVEPYKPKPIEGAVWVERDCPPPKNQVLTWYVEAFWDDLNNWLKNSPECVRVEYRFPDPGTLPPAKGEAVPDTSSSGDDWRVKAREIADECFDHDTKATPSVRDSLATKNVAGQIDGGYCFRIMGIMQKRGIKGPRGIINNPGTIMREALQAKKWWANKKK